MREAAAIQQLRKIIDPVPRKPLIIAKIEDEQAIKHLDSIIAACDGIMVARGDLGIEVPYEELPIIQRKIVKGCLYTGTTVIVATHILESMIEKPIPTQSLYTNDCVPTK